MSVVLILATEWEPSKGGLSTYNQELAAALARVGHEVHCVVQEAGRSELESAKVRDVRLHSASDRGVLDGSPFSIGVSPDVIIGHDRHTGPDAARWSARFGDARWLHLFHVHPAQIDGLKGEGSVVARAGRLEAGIDLANRADAVAAVGPLLAGWWSSSLSGRSVESSVPGLPELLPAVQTLRSPDPRVLLLGRAEDAELKGLHLAAEALSRVARRHTTMQFVVRGVPDAEVGKLEDAIRERYPKPARFYSLPFTVDRHRIAADIAGAWLVLQPSLEEGFGLVALEALAVGTPFLITSHSGVGQVLQEVAPELAADAVIDPSDMERWAARVNAILDDFPVARARTEALAARYRAAHTWNGAARLLVKLVERSHPQRTPPAARSVEDQLRDASTALRRVSRKIDGNWIPRVDEEAQVERWLAGPSAGSPSPPLLLIVGAPGTGKSALLGTIVDRLEQAGTPVLAVKADYLTRDVCDVDRLRTFLGLDAPVIDALSRAAHERGSALLVIDQLDALCELVDPDLRRLHVLLQVIASASAIPGVRVVASVREFELHHDARVRTLEPRAQVVRLRELSHADIEGALPGIPIPSPIAPALATPHALDLMVATRRIRGSGFSFPRSVGHLREELWRLAIEGRPERQAAAEGLADAVERSGSLWIEPVAAQLASAACEVLERRGLFHRLPDGRVGFRHQTLFDLARSRRLVAAGGVEDFVLRNQGQLQVRPFVRSVLMHLREEEGAKYAGLVDALWAHADLALHLRLLLVDTIADTEIPSRFDERALTRAVEDRSTRRRALAALSLRPSWFTVMSSEIERWMLDYPSEMRPVVVRMLTADAACAIALLTRRWMGTDEGARRCIDVLASATILGPEADPLLHELVPTIVRDPRYVLPGIGTAVAAASQERAAQLYRAAVLAEADFVAAGGTASGELGLTEQIMKLDVSRELILDGVEPAFRRIAELSRATYERRLVDSEESLRGLVERLLQKLDPSDLLRRAQSLLSDEALEPAYLNALVAVGGDTARRARWLGSLPSRLGHDPESAHLVRSIAPHLTEVETQELDAAIGRAEVIRIRADHDVASRRDIDKHNRAYRLYLRALLTQERRLRTMRAHDEGERHAVPVFHPDRQYKGGVVRSPMSPAQLGLATNADVLNALAQRGRWTRFSETEEPVGDGEQLLVTVGELAPSDPEKVASIAWDLRRAGRVEEARDLVVPVAKALEEVEEAEELALGLMCAGAECLDDDDRCAAALEVVARRRGLDDATISRILARLDAAQPVSPTASEYEADDVQDAPERSALFGDGFGAMVIPPGAFHWLASIWTDLARRELPDHDLWARAVRAALRADRRPHTWSAILSVCDASWAWLAGRHSGDLLEELEATVESADLDLELTRSYARSRTSLGTSALERFVDRLATRGAHAHAAELALLVATDGEAPWARARLGAWREGSTAVAVAHGVLAGVGALLGTPDRRQVAGELALEWIPIAAPGDLGHLFARAGTAWTADQLTRRILGALADRVPELDRDALGNLVLVLERFVDLAPELVLELIERALARALELEQIGIHPVIAEVLALTFNLRLRSPHLADRLQAVFERALQADTFAAGEALDLVDGRVRQVVFGRRLWPRPPRQPPRRRRRRR